MHSATLIAVPIISAAPRPADQVRRAKVAGADLIELRADLMGEAPVVALRDEPRALPLIVTIRCAEEGGAWHGSDAERAALFERFAALSPAYLDIEFAAWQRSPELRSAAARICRGAGEVGRESAPLLILSHHDLCSIPAEPSKALEGLLASPAAVVKAVFAADDARDGFRVLAALARAAPERKCVILATGAGGLVTRILARKFGAFLTFAALQAECASAPGQPTLSDLIAVYRWRELGAVTKVFGVVGWPVGHSFGPRVHNAAMGVSGIDGVYVPLPVGPTYAAFAEFMDYITREVALDVRGLSITIPHKEHASHWMAKHGFPLSDVARRVGATNTLVRDPTGGWKGDNTDVEGILAALALAPSDLQSRHAAVLGAGGIARAAIHALQLSGYEVTVFNRTWERAVRLAQELGCTALPWRARLTATFDVLVNCTSVGMGEDQDSTPIPADAPTARRCATVIDTVYAPARTRLLSEAQQRGCRIVGGAQVFLAQAAAQFKLWHNRPAPLETMRAALPTDD